MVPKKGYVQYVEQSENLIIQSKMQNKNVIIQAPEKLESAGALKWGTNKSAVRWKGSVFILWTYVLKYLLTPIPWGVEWKGYNV